MITVAIFIGGHDNSITILDDEKLLGYFAEERFSKIKHDNSVPFISFKEILKYVDHIDTLVINESNYFKYDVLPHLKKLKLTPTKIYKFPSSYHHLSHTFSGFFSSGFKEAVCLNIDSFGGSHIHPDKKNLSIDTTTIFYVENPFTFKHIYSNRWYIPYLYESYLENNIFPSVDLNYNLDIGMIYGSVCHYLGWTNLEAGKLMGLSSYGSLNSNIPEILFEDTLYANMNLFNSSYNLNYSLISSLKKAQNNPNNQIAKDLAYATQKALEHVILKRVEQALNSTPTNNLVLSGGCALNVVNNYILKKKFPNINFYIDPLGNDLGQSYGMAKYYYYQQTKSLKLSPLKSLYQGPRYSKKDLLNSIQKYV